MKIDHNSKLSQEIETMRNSIVDINSQYTHQQLEIYGYNPNKHWTILNQYEDAAGKVPTTITGMLKNRDLLNEERRLAKELEPYNNFVFSYRESNSLPAENIGKEPIPQVQSNSFLNDCYRVLKKLPKAIKKNPRTSATVAGTVVAVPLILNAGPFVNCVSHGGYEMQKSLDDIKLPELVGVASATSDNGADIPEDWYDETVDVLSPLSFDSRTMMAFKEVSKPLDEPIKIPDATTQYVMENYKKGTPIKIPSADFATWITVLSEYEIYGEQPMIRSHLIPISTDTDPEPEELAAICYFPYYGFADLSPIENHLVSTGDIYDEDGNKMSGYLVNPFDIPENSESYSNTQKLLYWKNPELINIAGEPIYWKDAIGKTPKELGLDKYDKPTASEKRAYKAKQDEKLYEQLVEQGIGEELAEKMVKDMRAEKIVEDMRTDTTTEKEKTNPLVYLIPAGLGAAGIAYFATRKKSGQLPTPTTPA